MVKDLTLEEIQQKKQELEILTAKLEKKEKYQSRLKEYNDKINKIQRELELRNEIFKKIYDYFIENKGSDFVKIQYNSIKLHSLIPNNFTTHSEYDKNRIIINEKDYSDKGFQQIDLRINNYLISMNSIEYAGLDNIKIFGSNVLFRGQNRYIKLSKLLSKLKEEQAADRAEKLRKKQLEENGNKLSALFKEKYPEAEIEMDSEWVQDWNGKGGETIKIIDIKFPNGNIATVSYGTSDWYFRRSYVKPPEVIPTKWEKIDNLRN